MNIHAKKKGQRRLSIVQVISNFPNARPVPPTNQGGTEKIVYELTENLVKRGHKVTLFAAKGSRSSARLVPYPKGLKDDGIVPYVLRKLTGQVDVVHDHTFTSSIGRSKLRIPTVCTLHLPVRNKVKYPVYVSKRARNVLGGGRGFYVYNGINPREYDYSQNKKEYMLFIGRILRQKGILHALTIAEITKKKLIIAGPIKDPALFAKEIAPRIRRSPHIHYVGAVGGRKKQLLLRHASCVLFPTVWEEPFGLVMIEAMACGTPVLGLKNGAVPEILSGFPGLICSSVKDMIKKVQRGKYPPPRALRAYVTKRFTTSGMTDRYLKIYRQVIDN